MRLAQLINTGGDAPTSFVDFVTCNLNYRPDSEVQVTENRQQVMIYCLREAAKVKKKDRRSS